MPVLTDPTNESTRLNPGDYSRSIVYSDRCRDSPMAFATALLRYQSRSLICLMPVLTDSANESPWLNREDDSGNCGRCDRCRDSPMAFAMAPLRDPLEHYLAKETDDLMFIQAVKIEYLTYADVAPVKDFRPSTFYAKKSGTKPINVGYILEESRLTLYFLTLCLVLCFVMLLVFDLVDATMSGMTVANNIIDTFCDLATTARCCTSRRFVILAWILGSFALSLYFKESCGQAPARNPFAEPFAQLSALSTTEPAADPATESA
ncbi:hypothetical protein HPB47_018734 [Ixodes persulcatus]|uniref:Uncharacterized protein n=1 Tax=Ixodes persulcatus TaxID=34615 RepID=A0AC60QK14_IXOPE|nr:hypothetical protein HPB47_018734 [Ixodes persulcatus]